MLSYQHQYHAGNFADVIKHMVLIRLLQYLTQKDKALFYLETHAGSGSYDLQNAQALKTQEAAGGIQLIWQKRSGIHHPLLMTYLEQVQKLNDSSTLRFYPGSPQLAVQNLRSKDRLLFCELHPHEYQKLCQLPHQDRRMTCCNQDGIMQLNAHLPPKERRGLIFIDPAYEIKAEYRTIPQALKLAYKRFATGVYCLWYPIIDNKLQGQIQRELHAIDANNYLVLDFYLNAKPEPGMYGCGLWIITPPYTLAEELALLMPELCHILNPNKAHFNLSIHHQKK